MSKKKSRRSHPIAQPKTRSKRPRDGHRAADRTRKSGWLKTCLWAALGLIFGTVVALQLTSPTGMPSAIARYEYLRLMKLPGSSSWLLDDRDAPVWEQFRETFTRIVSSNEDVQRHNALANVMTALATEPYDSTNDQTINTRADHLLQIDRDNLVARLAVGILRDRSVKAESSSAESDLEQFARLRAVVEQPPGYQRSTLHRQEYFNAWGTALKAFIKRPDVRLSLSHSLPEQTDTGIGYRNTYKGLLKISTTLAALSISLRAAGHVSEATACDRWVSQMALGIIENETDVAAQRLCARLLVERVGAESEAAHDLQAMIHDLDHQQQAAPRDLTSQSVRSTFGEPALDPIAYRRAAASLVIVLALVVSALGAGIVFLLATIGAALGRLIRRERENGPEGRPLPAYATVLMLFIPAVGISASVWQAVSAKAFFCSALWGWVELSAAVGAAALGIVAIAGFRSKQAVRRFNWRKAIVLGIALLPFILLASSPSAVARACQSLDMRVSTGVVLLISLAALLLISLIISPARLQAIAGTAALGLCVNAAAALVIMPFHRSADRRHQQAVVNTHGDEFSARLGKDWQAKYLASTRMALKDGAP